MLQELSFKKYLAGALVLGSLVSAEPALAKTHHTAKTSQSSESSFTKEKAMKVIEDNKKLLDAIEKQESGGSKDPQHAVGDHGLALGYMQIHPDYYAQAKKVAHWLPDYKTVCADKTLSRLCVAAHWASYGGFSNDRDKALVHHYGPSGRPGKLNSSDTRHHYWDDVKSKMED